MRTDTYDRLSFLDSSFLLMETPTSPMHVSGMTTFEGESLQTADGGIDIDAIRDYVASRLHRIPRYRQRLAYVPIAPQTRGRARGITRSKAHVRRSARAVDSPVSRRGR
jgi:Wax ester synthase/diacylglycerol acyltransferase catalytic domain